jgi:hypothetical protein
MLDGGKQTKSSSRNEKEDEIYEGEEQVYGFINTHKLFRNKVRTRNSPGWPFTDWAD